MNLFFMIVLIFVLIFLVIWVIEKIVVFRFGKYEGNVELDVDGSFSDVEKKGFKKVGISILIYVVIIVVFSVIGKKLFLVDLEIGDLLLNNVFFMKGMVFIIVLVFFIFGVVYGKIIGKIKKDKDVVFIMVSVMSDMGGYIILVFVVL